MEHLKILNLEHNAIGDEGAEALSRLTRLTTLKIADNTLTDLGVRWLTSLRNLVDCEIERPTGHRSQTSISDDTRKKMQATTRFNNMKESPPRADDAHLRKLLEERSPLGFMMDYAEKHFRKFEPTQDDEHNKAIAEIKGIRAALLSACATEDWPYAERYERDLEERYKQYKLVRDPKAQAGDDAQVARDAHVQATIAREKYNLQK